MKSRKGFLKGRIHHRRRREWNRMARVIGNFAHEFADALERKIIGDRDLARDLVRDAFEHCYERFIREFIRKPLDRFLDRELGMTVDLPRGFHAGGVYQPAPQLFPLLHSTELYVPSALMARLPKIDRRIGEPVFFETVVPHGITATGARQRG
jgi:hypothetical protein